MAGQSSYGDASAFVPTPWGHRRYSCGDRVANKYQLIREVNHGGMGVLWAAHNLRLDVHVALKFIRAENESSRAAVRLLREAQATARLHHPSIVRVFDFEETSDGQPFIVMELLDGYSLAALLEQRGRMETGNAVRMLLPIADALVALHEKGIVHRDVKPENIFLAYDDTGRLRPKLVDFGIARLDAPSACTTADGSCVIGSPEYMAPEQVLCEGVDARTDVWAFAVVIYEMVTGVRPFECVDRLDTLFRTILERTVPPITHYGVGDPELAAIVARALAKDRNARWPSMGAFGNALARWLIERGVETDICGASLAQAWRLVSGWSPPPSAPTGKSLCESTLSAAHTWRAKEGLRRSESACSVTLPSDGDAPKGRIESDALSVRAHQTHSRSLSWVAAACAGAALVFLGPGLYASCQSANNWTLAPDLGASPPNAEVESRVASGIAERATERLIAPASLARPAPPPRDGPSSVPEHRRKSATRAFAAVQPSLIGPLPTADTLKRDHQTSSDDHSIRRLDDLKVLKAKSPAPLGAATSRGPLEARR